MPHDLPPWAAVYQQAQRWLNAGCFAALVDGLRAVLRLAAGGAGGASGAGAGRGGWRSPPQRAAHRVPCVAAVDRLRAVLRVAAGRAEDPSAAVMDSRTLRSTPESGARAGYDGAKRKKGSKLHMAVDTLGHLLAAHVTPATADDRAEVGRLAQGMQE